MIPHSRPWILREDADAVRDTIATKSISHLRAAERLEDALLTQAEAGRCGLYASGTLALRAALLSIDLPSRSGVGIPAYTCRGVLDGVLSAGLAPVVIDCDESGLMDAEIARDAVRRGTIRAAVAVHQFGLVNTAMDDVAASIPVIEDCAHVAPKFSLKKSAGAIGSFEGTKFLGSGEGGYCLLRNAPAGALSTLGARLSDLIAALALRQLGRLEENIRRREEIARRYMAQTGADRVVNGERAVWFRFLMRRRSPAEVEKMIELAKAAGITARRPIMPHPLHRYAEAGGDCPGADNLWKTLVSIPLYPDLTEAEVDTIARFLSEQLRKEESS